MDNNYTILQKIGSGSFAKVYTAINKTTNQKVALKMIKKANISSSKLRQRLEREINNMKVLKHNHIVTYYESFETEKEMCIAMEFLSGGELFDYIAEKQGLNESEARNLFSQIASAVQHCHLNNLSHRDLKLENILLSESGEAKLIDFGFSKETHPNPMMATYCGSALYASPEMIIGKPYQGPECDIWSLGIILFGMLTACMPFDDSDWGSFLTSISRSDYPEPPNVSQNAKHLISRMLDPCSSTRATISEVLSHPWLNPAPRKSSLQLPPSIARRRLGISHSKSIALEITKSIITEVGLSCSCNCHALCTLRDSAVKLHCEDCEPMTPLGVKRPLGYGKSTASVCSSGYSSSSESLVNSPALNQPSSTKSNGDNYELVDIVFV